ncbi:sulfite exporter TauE/SafE family protein [Ilumatobacter sp.]|uniref:sulfite exporter TauE/SafE family protein n=1 Tax=Ilumatobacter sp. TaxID=1967498 RepID=UPI003B52F51F
MTASQAALAALAGVAAGLINAIAGGGTLVSFPALVALGVPAVASNVTNTVALVPGYLGGAVAQRRDLLTYAGRLRGLVVAAGVGGLIGSILLVSTSDEVFRDLVPFLILLACGLLGFQERIKAWYVRHRPAPDGGPEPTRHPVALTAAVFAGAVYGGYFGAGLGIMLLAVLGLALDDPLGRINSLKTTLSLLINVLAACFFVFSGKVEWDFAAVMAVSSLLGGMAGGRVAGRLDPRILRAVVVAFGVIVAIRFLL